MSSRVFVGRLANNARSRDLERLFKGYGEIREINIKSGFGFVEFKNSRDAEDVVYDFHGKDFLGERLIVELARGTRRGRDGNGRGSERRKSRYRLLVDNIPSGTPWQDLKDLMRKAGEVTFADVIRGRPGEGVVEFAQRSDMEYALRKMNESELNGQRITLREDSGHRSSSRRRSSRSASRSHSPHRRSSRRDRSASVSRSPRRRSSRRDRSVSRSRSPRRSSSRRDRSASRSPSRSVSRSRSPHRSSSRGDDKVEEAKVEDIRRSPAPTSRERSRDASHDRSVRRDRSYSTSRSRSPVESVKSADRD
ncbi:hypothetical protein BDF14DRAFT_1885339 [Spinellus fusiger]|nr:hypothetical protein BDF14DRAFT_1885339 [Spinellus fusiger]